MLRRRRLPVTRTSVFALTSIFIQLPSIFGRLAFCYLSISARLAVGSRAGSRTFACSPFKLQHEKEGEGSTVLLVAFASAIAFVSVCESALDKFFHAIELNSSCLQPHLSLRYVNPEDAFQHKSGGTRRRR